MAFTKRHCNKEELARRGDAMYDSAVRPHLSADDDGKFVAVDIETGAFEMAATELEACDRLGARVPAAQIWLVRVGSAYVYRFGRNRLRGKS